MYSILLLGVLGLLNSSMAMEKGGKWVGIKKFPFFNHTYEKLYRKMRDYSIRFMVRRHYHTLKNEHVRQKIRILISKYYESVYHYYNLTDEERDFIESVTGLFI